MSILIKGMEMPKNCLECSFKFVDIKYGDGCCLFTGIVCLSIGRQDRCPLIEIPTPHGRLIDADALFEAMGLDTVKEVMLRNWKFTTAWGVPIIEAEE